ncbi:MAG: DNA polymerase III subunit beta [Candidatus Eremiobacteraeota bacterium]|nr:DNA polymerase III subunit beta [Candidatus Eremiobacteraeota bacterium]MBV9646506.1 DNA polymerase III subunit beta [Candidatus Eremiobacteraeota bacterium]
MHMCRSEGKRRYGGAARPSPQFAPPYYRYDDIYVFYDDETTDSERWRIDRAVKFTCNTKDIANAVGAASKVVNAHTTVPILSNVLLTAQDGTIRIRATDLEITLEQGFSAEVTEAGSITVPAKLFSDYLGNLPPGIMELSGTPARASVKFERSNYDFHALPPDEYPPLPSAQRGATFSLDAKRFREGVGSVVFAASNEEARGAVLMGTLLEIANDSITMVATDGYRLAKWDTKLSRGIEGAATKYIVPSRALSEVARNLGSSDVVEVSALGPAQNQLSFTAGPTSIIARLVDGQYPNYAQVIPAQFDRSVTVNTGTLIGGLRRASLVAGDRANMVKLAVANQQLIITASSDVAGNAYEELEVQQTGDDLTIAFNAKYLAEILNHIDSPQAVLEFLGPLSPAAIRPLEALDGTTQLYVLMPLRQ